MAPTKCIKCEKEFEPIDGPVGDAPDPKDAEKFRYGGVLENVAVTVDIYRGVGGCRELAASYWHGSFCEKCLAESVQRGLVEEGTWEENRG